MLAGCHVPRQWHAFGCHRFVMGTSHHCISRIVALLFLAAMMATSSLAMDSDEQFAKILVGMWVIEDDTAYWEFTYLEDGRRDAAKRLYPDCSAETLSATISFKS